jgi:23S rRNA (cytosine1962-C5)-methyltransferase
MPYVDTQKFKNKSKVKSAMSSIADFQNRLRKNQNKRAPLFKKRKTTCYRLFDRDIPEYPVTVDQYGDSMLFSIYEGKHGLATQPFDAMVEYACELLGIHPSKVYKKTRRRRIAGQQHEKLDTAKQRFSVMENGLRFSVNLSDYTDTGLFLDHRNTRRQVMLESKGKRVLNLFAYTGAFTVYAHAGGAQSTTSVDLSKTYLNWTRENLELNHLDLREANLVQSDTFAFLATALQQNERFDLIIVDPPTASKSKRTQHDFDLQRDHGELLKAAEQLLVPGGKIYFSNNFMQFKMNAEGLSSDLKIQEITQLSVPEDFRKSPPPHRCWTITS